MLTFDGTVTISQAVDQALSLINHYCIKLRTSVHSLCLQCVHVQYVKNQASAEKSAIGNWVSEQFHASL